MNKSQNISSHKCCVISVILIQLASYLLSLFCQADNVWLYPYANSQDIKLASTIDIDVLFVLTVFSLFAILLAAISLITSLYLCWRSYKTVNKINLLLRGLVFSSVGSLLFNNYGLLELLELGKK